MLEFKHIERGLLPLVVFMRNITKNHAITCTNSYRS